MGSVALYRHMTLQFPARDGRVIYMQKRRSTKKRVTYRKFGRIERDILQDLTFGDLAYAHLCSGTSRTRFYQLARERATERYRRKRAIDRLKIHGFISSNGEMVHITDAGSMSLGSLADKNRTLLDQQIWDRKWRIAAFDIPERLAPLRAQVRGILKRAGFIKFQQSVWIFPHECRDLVQLIKSDPRVAPYIMYGVLESVEGESRLKKIFNLR